MSHFCMWAITKTDSEEELEKIMQPYHEYECDGNDDEYVIHADMTEKLQKDIEKYYKSENDGTLKEFIEDWNGCETFYDEKMESEKDFNPEAIVGNGSYAILSSDGTRLIHYSRYTNPNKKWDWWVIGGRWSKEKDCIKKSEFDYDKWYNAQRNDYINEYRTVKPLIDVKSVIRWETVKGLPRESVEVNAYYNQPTKQALNDADIWGISWEEVMDLTEEEYVAKHMASAAPCFGYVNSDGWFERAEMGWFACTSNEKEDWGEHFKKYWDSLPDDAVIWNVDCHI